MGTTQPGGYRLTYSYDLAGSRTLLIDPDGGRVTYSYDPLGRLATLLNAAGVLTTYEYDADGSLTTLSYGERRVMSYDPVGRLITEVQFNASGTAVLTIVDTFDVAGRKTRQVKNGTTTTFTYDAADRLLSQLRPGGKSVTYTMDANGNLRTIASEGLQPVTLTVDLASRLTTIQDGPTRVTYTYDQNGNLTEENPADFVKRQRKLDVHVAERTRTLSEAERAFPTPNAAHWPPAGSGSRSWRRLGGTSPCGRGRFRSTP